MDVNWMWPASHNTLGRLPVDLSAHVNPCPLDVTQIKLHWSRVFDVVVELVPSNGKLI